jgi:hypothetical protein
LSKLSRINKGFLSSYHYSAVKVLANTEAFA